MEVQLIDKQTLSYFESTVSSILSKVATVEGAIKSMGDDRVMSVTEATEYINFGKTWIMEHKEEIGFIQVGNSPIKFRKSKLDAFLAKYEKQSKFKK